MDHRTERKTASARINGFQTVEPDFSDPIAPEGAGWEMEAMATCWPYMIWSWVRRVELTLTRGGRGRKASR